MFVGVVAGAVLVNVAPLANSLHVVAPPHRPNSSSRAEERGSAGTPGRRAGLLRRARASMTELVALAPESDHYAPHRRARLPAAEQTVSVESLDSLMFHICLVMLVMFCGYLLRVPISVVDSHFTDHRSGKSFIDRETIVRVSNTAHGLLIPAAISRHLLTIIAETWAPFALVCLLLLRMADPNDATPVLRDFTCKQIFHGQPRVTEGDMRAHGAALSLGAAASPQHDAEAGREDFSEVAARRCASAPVVASPPIPQGD
ncbi:hypothetical protein EMIHUDRAFT_233412 [Emiliania huxleyi CCMP1516]|uniref:Bicarbonate transporter-like transmembrane domain-containing protein n=2 Tax=Emiliania huxleyi TaxID=2903 RepID=A0A0D3K265_EMIH1|nr:hypothetical protein EMIHUDRAFT_233412 [Emiliania huxleyi CCMP1516]EOD29850.1 hypothetical protein EMIHUDRAFT_233412 [Emiliania huxleyi CCMP1516]|eukprot:XP_005782279.1 hypothetical protein EMIHUDRAFT_233412 [Emiliania huxleyi CCMP1516]